ncbi:hypothetical protein BX600DRAFT_466327 [Xylariales sp. PMI_506]|nr:hypothetical protein BX600DRAFT_466327 [Xylariales sp. PMI_506]
MATTISNPSPIIERNPPNAVVYDLSVPNQATITLPVNSTWTSGLHWHETHVEYLRVVRGAVKVRTGTALAERIIRADDADPEVRIDRFLWHEWSRADNDDGDVVVVERTDPADGEKALFFWNLNGVILAAQHSTWIARVPPQVRGCAMDFWITLQLFVIFRDLDNFPVLLNSLRMAEALGIRIEEGSVSDKFVLAIEAAISHLLLWIASVLGRMFHLRAVRPEFLPNDVYSDWIQRKKSRKVQKYT